MAASSEESGKLERPDCLSSSKITPTEIYVRNQDLSDIVVCILACEFIAKYAKAHPGLLAVEFHDNKLTTEGAETIARLVLANCPNLTQFRMIRNPMIGDAGVEALAIALRHYCPKLYYLNLGDTEMTDVGFAAVCRYAPADCLKMLWCDHNDINNIPAHFRRFEKLESFGIGSNPLGGEWKGCEDYACNENASSALEYAKQLPDPDDDDEDVMVKPAASDADCDRQ